VEPAVRSLLEADYPFLEVVALDDRSEDETGAILDGIACQDPRLVVRHLQELPPGWLGKVHACHVGAQAASGDLLLFTDADVLFRKDALRRAVSLVLELGLGHLVVLPRLLAPGFLERGLVAAFGLLASAKFRVWELDRPGTRGFIGIGAFNLVTREAYGKISGHTRLALEVVDDVKLGLLLRRSGIPQAAAVSEGGVSVRWNPGFRKTVGGLIKNAFASTEWRWSVTLLGLLALAVLALGPEVAIAVGPPPVRILGGLTAVLGAGLLGAGARRSAGGSGLEGLAFPLAIGGILVAFLGSALRATIKDGIDWRGTRYSLASLRAGCVRERDFRPSESVGWVRPKA
jgi:hypothetical protein